MLGLRGAVPVELATVVSAKPLRLVFRGCSSSLLAGPLSPRRTAGPLVLQRVPSPGAGSPGRWEGLQGPPHQFSLLSASRPAAGLEQRDSVPQAGPHHRGMP
ncbi:hypothetical protein NDU88_004830 [Pleurodeles waltl]|uniref:Uncharacterized protein n=1 Tax=Pleurodeles waltl TaxID=8319 RepID=A0AAV7MXH9_PLEWA|nr:hypothetical protein NDU88_004830 [Pleurodeles waltl]